MELSNEFVVTLPVDEAWNLLTDVERIAPCMPGAELQEIEGDDYKGVVKVKVGPITAQYKGKAHFVEKDDGAHRAVLKAEGRDVRGQGHANATITAALSPEGDGTRVNVVTDLAITGRAAQFGRGVLAEVSAKLMSQFVECLETTVLSGGPAPEAEPEPAPPAMAGATSTNGPAPEAATGAADAAGAMTPGAPTATGPAPAPAPAAPRAEAPPVARPVEYAEAEPVDLFEAAGAPVLKRLLPAVIGAVLAWLLAREVHRRLGGGS